MAQPTVRITGLKEAEALLNKLSTSVRAPAGHIARVGWPKTVYSWGIEFGRHRNGRLARRAGGAFALTDALKAEKPKIASTLARAIPLGPNAVISALKYLAIDVWGRTLDNLDATVYATEEPRSSTGRLKYRRSGNLRRAVMADFDGQQLAGGTDSGGPRQSYRKRGLRQ